MHVLTAFLVFVAGASLFLLSLALPRASQGFAQQQCVAMLAAIPLLNRSRCYPQIQ